MKKIWGNFKNFKKSKKFQLGISLLVSLVAVIVVALNMIGIWKIPNDYLLSIIIVLLCSVTVIYIVEELDVFEEIRIRTSECSEKLGNIEEEKKQNFKKFKRS